MKSRSEKVVKLAVELYEKLKSGNKVAKKLGLSHSACYRLLTAAGVNLPDRHSAEVQERKKKLHGEIALQAAQDYANGMHSKELCKKYRASMWAIRTAVKDAGVKMRGRGGRFRELSEEERKEVADLYLNEHLTQDQIAVMYGASQHTVCRWLKHLGIAARGHKARGERHGSWKGGRTMTSGGYVNVLIDRSDPLWCMADSIGYALEHRIVMARKLGRPLSKNETVHHIDGDKTNNKIKNLQLRIGRHGRGERWCCADCGSFNLKCVELA